MEGVDSGSGGGGGRRRISLREQMSAVDGGGGRESHTGLSLDSILGNDKRSPAAPGQVNAVTAAQVNRTFLDIIRDATPAAAPTELLRIVGVLLQQQFRGAGRRYDGRMRGDHLLLPLRPWEPLVSHDLQGPRGALQEGTATEAEGASDGIH